MQFVQFRLHLYESKLPQNQVSRIMEDKNSKKGKKKIGQLFRTLQGRSSLALLVTAAVLIQINGAVQYFYSRKVISEEVQMRAKSELKVKNLEILQVVNSVETAVNNTLWAIERDLSHPDSIFAIEKRLVSQNKMVTGCGIGFVSNYYPDKGQWFEPYVERLDDGTLEARQIGSESHDYLNSSWYLDAIAADSAIWTEPYLDNAGARELICTYAIPIHDSEKRIVGIMGVDISLNWMVDMFATDDVDEKASILVSRNGRILACPDKSMVMQTTIDDFAKTCEDTMVWRVNDALLSGDSGYTVVVGNNGEKSHVYYAPVEGGTDWSMAVIFSDRKIFHNLHAIGNILTLLMLLGLGLMVFIMYRTVKGFKRLQEVSAEKERIGSELKIASDIQKGMLPKTFPPYPDQDEISMYGVLLPAKEVGGDLYDFYIRNNKLFFCLGDVSGKGVPASLVMALTRSLFRSVTMHNDKPGEVMKLMNNAMSEMNESSMFVTLFIGILDLQNGKMSYSNAGHNPPVIIGEQTRGLAVDSNIALGLMPNWEYSVQETVMVPGETLFLYTDGLTEAENETHAQFGEERMMEILSSTSKDPREMIDSVTKAIDTFVQGAEQSDDLTMLAVNLVKTKATSK